MKPEATHCAGIHGGHETVRIKGAVEQLQDGKILQGPRVSFLEVAAAAGWSKLNFLLSATASGSAHTGALGVRGN
jgi:hypothetical protein